MSYDNSYGCELKSNYIFSLTGKNIGLCIRLMDLNCFGFSFFILQKIFILFNAIRLIHEPMIFPVSEKIYKFYLMDSTLLRTEYYLNLFI